MNLGKSAPRGFIAAVSVACLVFSGARAVSAQHVTPAMAQGMTGTGSPDGSDCEGRARQASSSLDGLSASLERARLTSSDAERRAAVEAVRTGLADVKARLDPCRAGTAPARAQRPGEAPAPPAAGAIAGMDHSTMNMSPAGAAAAPTTERQINSPAEAALQSFRDALEIGNRELALQWLAPEATVTEAGVTDGSRDAYASAHMGLDMSFLKTARVVLLDRQVHPGGESTYIVSTSRVTGRAGEIPVDATVTEGALLKRTPHGWRIVSLQWSLEPVKADSR